MDLKVESGVDNRRDFTAQLLRSLDYDDNDRIVIRYSLPFLICGETSVAQTDICIMDDDYDILLLRLTSLKDPEPQVIANAIAAFALTTTEIANATLIFQHATLSGSLPSPWSAPR
jgi:hypothetical protein